MFYQLPQSIKLLLCRATAATDEGVATAYVPIPSCGRSVTGGIAWFESPVSGDYVMADIYDLDNVLGGGQVVVDSWQDDLVPSDNQGWFMRGSEGVDLNSLLPEDPKDIGPNNGLYIRIRGFKADLSSDVLRVNIRWGKRLR